MATNLKNLSIGPDRIPSARKMVFGIVVADWNSDITHELMRGAHETLLKHGAQTENILVKHVPGAFELTLGAQFMAEYGDFDGIICLGCVIQGETRHFDYICQSVSHGLTELNMTYNIPIIFGVLTTNTLEQAKARAGGELGNKGEEAAIAAIQMAHLQLEMEAMEDGL
ncbi:MAG: 6,7-dimethyl-8-ribityllumazine synthase [Bacteroidales bacterium]|nr:6,7-dimethyl-8-ribityllumazine synthase [Bacteroidales bacterium]